MKPIRAWAVVFKDGDNPLVGWGVDGQFPIFSSRAKALNFSRNHLASGYVLTRVIPVEIREVPKKGKR
jgi:hypothetical protein